MRILTLKHPSLFFGSRDIRRMFPWIAVVLLCTSKMLSCCLYFVLIDLEKNKHREEIKLATGSEQGEAKAVSEDCCCLFNTKRCYEEKKNISLDTYLCFLLQI